MTTITDFASHPVHPAWWVRIWESLRTAAAADVRRGQQPVDPHRLGINPRDFSSIGLG